MKRDNILYWLLTGLVAAGMAMSGTMYLTKNPAVAQGFQQLGYPEYFVVILGIAKLVGAVILLLPLWANVKEWAYAGFGFVFVGAIWTHLATSTPWINPFIALVMLALSYWLWKRRQVAHS